MMENFSLTRFTINGFIAMLIIFLFALVMANKESKPAYSTGMIIIVREGIENDTIYICNGEVKTGNGKDSCHTDGK